MDDKNNLLHRGVPSNINTFLMQYCVLAQYYHR